jgi:hypothetical protein
MRTRILFRALTCLLAAAYASHADEATSPRDGPDPRSAPERPCRIAGERCAISSDEWAIYPDSSPGAPEFWSTPSVEVREITVCGHGLQFLFPAVQDGKPRLAALVFPVPTAELLAQRMGLTPGSRELDAELAHLRQRYAGLLRVLDDLSGGWVGEMRRELPGDPERPRIWPTPLVLNWGDARHPLRGYLDVYFTDPQAAAVVAAADNRDATPDARTEAIVASPPAVSLALGVAPNPGGSSGYTVSLGLPADGPATLRLFDVAGRRVATLLEGDRPAGSARLRWDGRSAGGSPVAAGMYFARLETQTGSRTVKIVHLAR